MDKKIILMVAICFSLLLLSLIVGTANATTETLVIEPMQDISKRVKLEVSESVSGSFLVSNGTIDFFVTDPDESVLFSYEQTEDALFNFTASKSGNYTMHLVNSVSPTKVLVEFTYGVNYVVVLQETFKVWHNIDTWSITMPTITPFPWEILVTAIVTFLGALSHILNIGKKIAEILGRLRWWWKYRKPRTPVVINLGKS